MNIRIKLIIFITLVLVGSTFSIIYKDFSLCYVIVVNCFSIIFITYARCYNLYKKRTIDGWFLTTSIIRHIYVDNSNKQAKFIEFCFTTMSILVAIFVMSLLTALLSTIKL